MPPSQPSALARWEDGSSSRLISGRRGLRPRTWFDSPAVHRNPPERNNRDFALYVLLVTFYVSPVSRRTERLSSLIQQELALMILRELNDPRLTGLPSITRVKVSDDLSYADVYVTSMGTPGQQSAALHALQHSAGMLRTKLTKILSI